ncbi:MAG: hypothetical protein NTZ05_06500 [Chloroflexi bacterium]|nr:hypothetical protein [Chloroflexota bacterium]
MKLSARLLLGASLALALTVACSSPPPAAPAAAPSPAVAAPTAVAPPPATATPAPTPKPPEFATLMKAAAGGYKATYNLKVTRGGVEQMSGAATMYTKPPKMRFDMATKIDGKESPMSMYRLDDGNFMCATLGAQQQCLKLGQGELAPGLDTQQAMMDKPDDFEITPKGSRTIAGAAATCFTAKKKSDASAAVNEMCYSADGIPLAFSIVDKDALTVMEATSFSKTVTEADFTLPSKPVDMPGMSGGMPAMPGGAGASGMPSMPPGMPTPAR